MIVSRFVRGSCLTLVTSLAAACGNGGDMGDGGDAGGVADANRGACTANACNCAERGPPDYSHDGTGMMPTGADAMQNMGLVRANHWRTAAGIAPLNGNAEINQAATAHGEYLAMNGHNCWGGGSPHVEVQGCTGFTGQQMSDRMMAAGYSWSRASEVINWEPDANAAVDGWMWTVYHRLPFLDYALVDVGYGHVPGTLQGRQVVNQVMDFGTPPSGTPGVPPAQPAVFPLPGQTAVPTSFAGNLEGPTPQAPPNGWPSGTVVSMHFPTDAWTVTEHHLFYNAGGACVAVDHTFMSRDNDPTLMNDHANAVFFYANQPIQGQVEYVAQVVGTVNGQPYTRAWAFTTQ